MTIVWAEKILATFFVDQSPLLKAWVVELVVEDSWVEAGVGVDNDVCGFQTCSLRGKCLIENMTDHVELQFMELCGCLAILSTSLLDLLATTEKVEKVIFVVIFNHSWCDKS